MYHAGMPTAPLHTAYTLDDVQHVTLIVGMEVHVELATRTKVFSSAPNPAAAAGGAGGGASVDGAVGRGDGHVAAPNTLIDPVVLALPGALPVLSRGAVEMAMRVGLALGCTITAETKWDRKSYFYPDLPKAYQISQYDLPLCADGAVDLPLLDGRGQFDPERGSRRIGIIRAHLEEDAGKLLHEVPGGGALDGSIVDLNRAGAPLLEIVTQPDFGTADEVVGFAKMLRNICRFLGVTEGIMQKGQMRFEPNINTRIAFKDGRTVTTPIVEVKNLNSFKSLRGAIEYELREQPARWLRDGREIGAGSKRTRGWDDERGVTFEQREKEDAHDYRYFPDPDLPPVRVDAAWLAEVASTVPELPLARLERYMVRFGLGAREAMALVEERDVCFLYEDAITHAVESGVQGDRAGKLCANMVLQSGAKRANERGGGVLVSELGISGRSIGAIVGMRERGVLSASGADELFGLMCDPALAGRDAREVAGAHGLLLVRDDAALEGWCRRVIEENAPMVEEIRGGKVVAVGRLVGGVMKLASASGANADAAAVRAKLLELIGVKE
jgi:aspartyl-tRNA(Asn)/glutamyl-tRNA(Gln) amidotransferase subunit B